MKWLMDSNNMPGGEEKRGIEITGGGTYKAKSFCQDTHNSPYICDLILFVAFVKCKEWITAKTPGQKNKMII